MRPRPDCEPTRTQHPEFDKPPPGLDELAFIAQTPKIDAGNSRFREVARTGYALLPGDLERACFE